MSDIRPDAGPDPAGRQRDSGQREGRQRQGRQREGHDRQAPLSASGGSSTGAGRHSSVRGRVRAVALAVLFALVVTTPLWASASVARLVVDVLVLVAVTQLWSYLAGTAGLVSLANHGFAGVGAYALWNLSERVGLNPVVAVAGAGLAALTVAALVSPLVLRLSPVPAAITTWVVAEAAAQVVTRTGQLGGGVPHRVVQRVVQLGSTRDGIVSWLAVVLGVGVVVVVYAHRRSRYGLALIASADDPVVATGLGLPVLRARRTVWLLAAMAAGMAGAVAHFRTADVSAVAFDAAVWTYPAIAVAGIGGLSTVEGPFVGAVLYVAVREIVGSHEHAFNLAMAGVGLLGLVSGADGWWGFARRALPVEPFPVRRRPSR